jgi:hypothetical protein
MMKNVVTFFFVFFCFGWVGKFWNLATTKKRKIAKYVYFVLDSMSFREKDYCFFEKQCHHISCVDQICNDTLISL